MKVLIAYASRHGATAGIAERVAAGLRDAGLSAEARPVTEVSDVGAYDAVVVGGAAYMFHWLKDATKFVKRHREALRDRPVWLFSSGPLGTDLVDEEGRDILDVTRPKEFDELHAAIRPRGERVFFGAWDPDAPPVGLGERLLRRMPASRDATPAGDFRDWLAIDAWTAEIAAALQPAEATDAGAPRG
jgi:menaquinone-dependent protoporphyrinogen oxidase